MAMKTKLSNKDHEKKFNKIMITIGICIISVCYLYYQVYSWFNVVYTHAQYGLFSSSKSNITMLYEEKNYIFSNVDCSLAYMNSILNNSGSKPYFGEIDRNQENFEIYVPEYGRYTFFRKDINHVILLLEPEKSFTVQYNLDNEYTIIGNELFDLLIKSIFINNENR